jgi:hypothetical protein
VAALVDPSEMQLCDTVRDPLCREVRTLPRCGLYRGGVQSKSGILKHVGVVRTLPRPPMESRPSKTEDFTELGVVFTEAR